MNLTKAKTQYNQQKGGAKQRGIGFEMSFEEWCKVWRESGVYDRRGNRRGQFVMCRPGDNGPYAVGNVEIRTALSNVREGHFLHSRARGSHQIQNEYNEPDEELEYWEEYGHIP